MSHRIQHTFRFRLLLLFLFTAACISQKPQPDAPGGLSGYQLQGVVQSESGEPLSGITVELEGRSVSTGRDGRFSLDQLQSVPDRIRLSGPLGTGNHPLVLSGAGMMREAEFTYPVVTEVILLHDNDLHFNFNDRDAFLATVGEIRQTYRNVWLLNGGDTFVRHAHRWAVPDSSYYVEQSRRMMELMNETGYDAAAAGNHELDYAGPYSGEALGLAAFPILAANIDLATVNLPQLDPYTLFETDNGLTIAVLGLSTVNFEKPGVSFRDPVETTRAYRNLAVENDLFVVLSHIGIAADRILAAAVPEIDVIVGGHSHTLLEEAEMVSGVLIGQAGGPPPEHQVDPEWPKYLGKIRVVFHNDRVVEKSGRVITIGTTVPAD